MRKISVTLAILLAASTHLASAQMDTREGIALQNQILELRQELQQLQTQSSNAPVPLPEYRASRGSAAPSGGNEMTAQLLGRVQTLEDQVRTLRGQVDELQNQVQRQTAELSKQVGDLGFQMQQGASRPQPTTPAPSQAPQPSRSPAPGNLGATTALSSSTPEAAGTPRRTPELALQEGNAALARRDYPAAETAAREVLSGPRGPRSYDAQFLLAQSQAGARNYQAAALAYDDVYRRNHTGSRAQDSLVGLAGALLNLNEKGAACGALSKLQTEFPQPRSEVRDAAAAVRSRAGCG